MKKISIVLLMIFSLSFASQASENQINGEDDQPRYTKNIISGEAGIWIMGQAANLGYERILHVSKSGIISASATYGYWKDEYEDGNLFSITGNYLLGKKSHHLELNLGALAQIHYDQYYTDQNKFDHISLLPDVFIGYRYKKPAGHLSLKAGVGFPSLVSVGIGVAF